MIGSGTKTRILEDAWLQDVNYPFVTSQHPALQSQMVSTLMKTGSREWDEEIIMDLFNERDWLLILGTPLSHSHDDIIGYWYKDGHGSYTVKSAFKMIQELKGEWSPNDNSGFWRRLWNLKIPHKVISC